MSSGVSIILNSIFFVITALLRHCSNYAKFRAPGFTCCGERNEFEITFRVTNLAT